MIDVIIAGAGPAGSVAALVLARAGVRVCLLEREAMPRPKLCGDTINPGAVAALAELGLSDGPLASAVRLRGMFVTGPGAQVQARYPGDQVALSLSRSTLDRWLAEQAVAAGARLECGVRVLGPLRRESGAKTAVTGVELVRGAKRVRMPSLITIAADGRRSVLARAAGLSHHPARPRRWAFGAYVTDVQGMAEYGEMHLRRTHYVGLAPLGHGLTNVCVVTGPRPGGRTPEDVIRRVLNDDVRLRERTAGLRLAAAPLVLGPLAVDCRAPGTPGLLLAGDAAGFVDPMTGDGIHLAIRGGMLAAGAALQALESGDLVSAVERLRAGREAALAGKLRFNRALRRMSSSATALEVVSLGARLVPSAVRRLVRYAGDAA